MALSIDWLKGFLRNRSPMCRSAIVPLFVITGRDLRIGAAWGTRTTKVIGVRRAYGKARNEFKNNSSWLLACLRHPLDSGSFQSRTIKFQDLILSWCRPLRLSNQVPTHPIGLGPFSYLPRHRAWLRGSAIGRRGERWA